MKKKIGKIGIIVILLAGLSYVVLGNPFLIYHNWALKKAVTAAHADSVVLNDIIPFEWDTLYTFEPYTSADEMEKIIGFYSRLLKESVSEGMVQLLFIKDNSVAAYVCAYPDALGYNIIFNDSISYDEKAVFSVSRNEGITVLRKE